ncbi:MAG: GH3 auxin-responsive promoter family protein, partial [Bdellovibrionales bacterium]
TIWPNVKGVVTWTGGNCKLLIPKLEKLLPPQTKIIEAGYLSTEFRGTITIDCNRNLGLPTLDDNFYEFAPVETWDRGDRHTLLLSQLEKGKRYYIIVTTPNGLYRYFIDDIVEVTGHFESTPTLSFVQKAKGITSLTGEKLYENQVIEAMAYTARLHGLDATFFMMLANREHFSYVLYIECDNKFETKMVSDTFNACLSRLNLEYSSKVDSGRLKPAHVRKLKNKTADAYKAFCLNSGQREAQFKFVHLQYHNDTSFTFEKYTET